MKRKRMTRVDSREQTTQRLLAAAQGLIAKQGLGSTSVEDIAAAAGYSRGAFYSNFGGKHDLFIELLRRDHEESTRAFLALINDQLPLDQIQARARELYGQLYRDNETFMNWMEARLLSARDARFRAKLSALMAEKRSQIMRFIEYFDRRAGSQDAARVKILATGFMSLVEGVKLYMLSSPMDLTPEAAESILTVFVDSIMQLARARGALPSAGPALSHPARD